MALSDDQVSALRDTAGTSEAVSPGAWISVAASDVKALCDEVVAARNPVSASGDHTIGGQGSGIDPNPPIEASTT